MSELLETGIPLIDRNLGGLLEGRAYLVFGAAGMGKSLLGLQFLSMGVAREEPGLLLTLRRPDDLLSQPERLGFGLDSALEQDRFILLEYAQRAASRIMRFGWKPFLDRLRPLATEYGIRRAVFDPIYPLFAGSTDEGRLRYDLRYLVQSLEEWGWTTLFLNDRRATQGHPAFYRVFSEICSGVFELQDETEELTSYKYLSVHKARHAVGSRRKIPFELVMGDGLVESSEGDRRMPVATQAGSASQADAARPATRKQPWVPDAQTERPGRRRVLLADDDPFILRLLAKGLGQEFELLTTGDGIEALTLALTERPDVVVLDMLLPRITGLDICRSLRKSGSVVPLIFMSSAAVDEKDRLMGLTLGANGHISKPFSVREVAEKIRVASRCQITDRSPGAAELDLLHKTAVQNVISYETLMERSRQSCTNAARDQEGPPGLVRLRWKDTQENGDRSGEVGGGGDWESESSMDRMRSVPEKPSRPRTA